MTTFIGLYRGAAIYQVGDVDPSEGVTLRSKVVAKAKIPELENLKVDFIAETATREESLLKIKKAIDKYLTDHDMDKFETDIH